MSSPTTCVFDLVPPNRPGINDVGGGQKVNDGTISDPAGMPDATEDNQKSNLIVRYGMVVPVEKITVHFAAGVPSINKASGVITLVVIATFTVTDNGVGDTSITWPANTFPPAIADPDAKLTGATVGMIACESIANGVRIRTKDGTNVAADLPFNVDIF